MRELIYPTLPRDWGQGFIIMGPALSKELAINRKFPLCVLKEVTSGAVALDDLTVSPTQYVSMTLSLGCSISPNGRSWLGHVMLYTIYSRLNQNPKLWTKPFYFQ